VVYSNVRSVYKTRGISVIPARTVGPMMTLLAYSQTSDKAGLFMPNSSAYFGRNRKRADNPIHAIYHVVQDTRFTPAS
jgi:hypothetical protein